VFYIYNDYTPITILITFIGFCIFKLYVLRERKHIKTTITILINFIEFCNFKLYVTYIERERKHIKTMEHY